MDRGTRNLIISLAALGVAIWGGAETRRYNRLSVQPHLDVELRETATETALLLRNTGMGSAVVQRLRVYAGSELLCDGEGALDRLGDMLGQDSIVVDRMAQIPIGMWIRPDQEVPLLRLPQGRWSRERSRILVALVQNRYRIEVGYRSVYGQEYSTKLGEAPVDYLTDVFRLVRDALLMAAAVATIVGVIWGLQQLQATRQATSCQAYHTVLLNLQSEGTRRARRHLLQPGFGCKPVAAWTDEDRLCAERVCHTYDTVAILVHAAMLEPRIITDNWGWSIRACWSAVEPYVVQRRLAEGNPTLWDDFEELAQSTPGNQSATASPPS